MTNPTEAPMANAIDDVKEFVLVPKEPTEAMLEAGSRAINALQGTKPDDAPLHHPAQNSSEIPTMEWWEQWIETAEECYEAMLAAAPSPAPSQHTGWSDEAETDRMQKISEVIAHLQSIQDRFGDACVYTRRGGMSWGAVALNRRDDDKKNGVFDLQAQHDIDMTARLQQVQRLINDNRELRTALSDASSISPSVEPLHIDIAHDSFSGDVIGSYVTREGKRGFVVQQDGTRVVHVYGEKFAGISPSVAKESGEP